MNTSGDLNLASVPCIRNARGSKHAQNDKPSISASFSNLLNPTRRDLARYRKMAEEIEVRQETLKSLTDEELRGKTAEFISRLEGLPDKEEGLNHLLPEAYAVVREAARRTLEVEHYQEQIMGGIAVHEGKVAEMVTGEGKTLMATLPLYLNALSGQGVHLATTDNYLARTGAVEMGPIFHLLGMSVGVIQSPERKDGTPGMTLVYDPEGKESDIRDPSCPVCAIRLARWAAYECSITYGPASEFGFDYLRDQLCDSPDDVVQRRHAVAIVDEFDAILLDEARLPLIISSPVPCDFRQFIKVDVVVRKLKGGVAPRNAAEEDDPGHDCNNPEIHYLVNEASRSVTLTDAGARRLQRMLHKDISLDPELLSMVSASLKAHNTLIKDEHYFVEDSDVVIIDPNTGWPSYGRRYEGNLHQAIEAKERRDTKGQVRMRHESRAEATISYQGYFKQYQKLAGMTGTALSAAPELHTVYGVDVFPVPTHEHMIRVDHEDLRFDNMEEKLRAAALLAIKSKAQQRPILIGTRSVESSETFSLRLNPENIRKAAMLAILRSKGSRDNQLLFEIDAEVLEGRMREHGLDPEIRSKENLEEFMRILGLENSKDVEDRIRQMLNHGCARNVLNAKGHEKEARIIAGAGKPGEVTIATNMAGRGVDVRLGGKGARKDDPGAVLARSRGGLLCLGLEHYESERVDDQFRGRSGRQGDPGETIFLSSPEDAIYRRYPSAAEPQKCAELNAVAARRRLMKFDEVCNAHRDIIADQRKRILSGANLRPLIMDYVNERIKHEMEALGTASDYAPGVGVLYKNLDNDICLASHISLESLLSERKEKLAGRIMRVVERAYERREKQLESEASWIFEDAPREFERRVTLRVINNLWPEYIAEMQELRDRVGLTVYAQQDPLIAFIKESSRIFEQLNKKIVRDLVRNMMDSIPRKL